MKEGIRFVWINQSGNISHEHVNVFGEVIKIPAKGDFQSEKFLSQINDTRMRTFMRQAVLGGKN